MKLSEANRPLRVLDKLMQGGLGAGNIGVVMSRHGTGKMAVLTSIALDHAIHERNVLCVFLDRSVDEVRAYHDEILAEIIDLIDVNERNGIYARAERHKQIYTYKSGGFSVKRLTDTLAMLANHAEFKPAMVEIHGWPDFQQVEVQEIAALQRAAKEYSTEIWLSAHTHLEDHKDRRGLPDYIARLESNFAVLLLLEPQGEVVNIRCIKSHDAPPPQGIHLEFDPKTQLIRWR
ncbi:MAG: hypothetical protein L0Z55_08235 [Planctomycetes bacterium]|nr:hypothetical protein [Planctomycetota bacterium]